MLCSSRNGGIIRGEKQTKPKFRVSAALSPVTPLRPKQEPEITVGVHQYKLRRFGHKAMWGNGGCQKSLRGQQAKLLILRFFYNSGRETCMAMTPFIQAHLIFFRGMGNV